MHDEIAVELGELSQVFIACPNEKCGTEIGFDLTKQFDIRRLSCPNCNAEIYEVDRTEDRIEFTWPILLKKLFADERRPRMVFKIKRPQAIAK